MDSLKRIAGDDGWINVAQHDDIKRAGGSVAEIILNNPRNGVRADGEWRSGRREAKNIGDVADAGVGDEREWEKDIRRAGACGGVQTSLHDDVRRADDVEAGTVSGWQGSEEDCLRAKIHNTASHADPVGGDEWPVGNVGNGKSDRTRAAERDIRPTRRHERPVGCIAWDDLVGGTDEREAVGGETNVEHQVA